MGHFAEIDKDGIVQRVIAAEQDFINSGAVGDASNWIQTSYNSRGGVHYKENSHEPSGKPHLRYNYAGIGFTYDKVRDAFIPPQTYPSWIFNETTANWDSPIPRPILEGHYHGEEYHDAHQQWDEENLTWKIVRRRT